MNKNNIKIALLILLCSFTVSCANNESDTNQNTNKKANNDAKIESTSKIDDKEDTMVILLDKYITIDYSGYDGFAEAYVTFDKESFVYDYVEEIQFKEERAEKAYNEFYRNDEDLLPVSLVLRHIRIAPSAHGLSNGDSFELILDDDSRDIIERYFNVSVDLSENSKNITVAELAKGNLLADIAYETDKTAFTVDGKTLTLDNVSDEDTYVITIVNNNGVDMTGWAVAITVGKGYDIKNVMNVDLWANLIKRKPYNYHYNCEIQDDKLIITPDSYRVKDNKLVNSGFSITPEAANIPPGSMKITLVAKELNPDMEIIAYGNKNS